MKMLESKLYKYECPICGYTIFRIIKLREDEQFECPHCKNEKSYLFSILNIRKFIKETQERFERIEFEFTYTKRTIDIINKRLDGLEADIIKYLKTTNEELKKEIKQEIIDAIGITL